MITGHIGDLDHNQITKKISDLDQDHLKGSPFERIEINCRCTTHSRIIELIKLQIIKYKRSNTKGNELDG